MSDPVSETGWRLEQRLDGLIDFVAADGTRHRDVDIRRGFPLSAPRAGVAVIAAGGEELAWIASLDAAEATLAEMLEAVLSQREFVPIIQQIKSISEGRPAEWTVVTDRGPHRFLVAHPDDVSRQPDGGLAITDTSGIRYRILAPDSLDPRSCRLHERAG